MHNRNILLELAAEAYTSVKAAVLKSVAALKKSIIDKL
jgi:hypothetical protein